MRTTIIWVAFTVLANILWCSVEVGEVDESTRVDRSLQGGFQILLLSFCQGGHILPMNYIFGPFFNCIPLPSQKSCQKVHLRLVLGQDLDNLAFLLCYNLGGRAKTSTLCLLVFKKGKNNEILYSPGPSRVPTSCRWMTVSVRDDCLIFSLALKCAQLIKGLKSYF